MSKNICVAGVKVITAYRKRVIRELKAVQHRAKLAEVSIQTKPSKHKRLRCCHLSRFLKLFWPLALMEKAQAAINSIADAATLT
jgi:hypothetical protein